ncbi:hypothetical protein D779_2679 [Imhoffiella purpurea]|uniref:Uncharacterized protein n=1 Tax=Imhoffiella purpurea TaxID=1249627 RepID=W9V4R8_9GAMM|nr:hypothetical protein D779_2679 [Imhoffiella purpurea]
MPPMLWPLGFHPNIAIPSPSCCAIETILRTSDSRSHPPVGSGIIDGVFERDRTRRGARCEDVKRHAP